MTPRISRPFAALGASTVLALAAMFAPMGAVAQKSAKAAPVAPASFDKDVAPVVTKFCGACHGGGESSGGVALPKSLTATGALANPALWSKVAKNVGTLRMPPVGAPQPTKAQRSRLVQWVDGALRQDCAVADPGRVTIRRLNRAEYNNTVSDLLGIQATPADDFPSDDVGYGFDNIGDVLSVSPLLMEKYMAAAERLSKAAIRVPKSRTLGINGSEFAGKEGVTADGSHLLFFSSGTGVASFTLSTQGQYRLRFSMGQQAAGPEAARAVIEVDGAGVAAFDVVAGLQKPDWYELPLPLEAGKHRVSVHFANDYYRAQEGSSPEQDRNMVLAGFECVGPRETVASVPKTQAWMVSGLVPGADEPAAARQALTRFATKAYRRPATSEEMDRLMGVYGMVRRAGEPFERGLQIGVQAILASPSFLFRVELDGAPNDPKAKRVVNGYEIASRLSYFLWSSMPDDRLFALAGKGELTKPAILDAEVKRMLADPKAGRLTQNFAMQWLELRKLANFQPDAQRFPAFSEGLRNDMLAEAGATFDFVRSQDRSILDFLDARYVFVNERLAKLYGMPAVKGDALQRIATSDPHRGGLLTQAGVLAASSNPTRTSPTKRGKWILEVILGSPPPPPPPGIAQLDDQKHVTAAMSLRQMMEEHRKNPACATCHLRMDALGFGLENYNAIGAWRTKDGTVPIDATATLPDGKSFSKPDELKAILLASKGTFARTFAGKMLTFAIGRGVEPSDDCLIDAIAANSAKEGYSFSSIVRGVVQSDAFRKRRGDGTKP